jgi:hypothetical protein
MDLNQRGDSHQPKTPGMSSRRGFLRKAGIGAVATAAFAGLTDVTGMTSAFAKTKELHGGGTLARAVPLRALPAGQVREMKQMQAVQDRQMRDKIRPDSSYMYCYCTPGNCGGPCHPSNVWCHYCYNVSGYCGPDGYYCVGNGCGSGYFCP